MHAEGLDSFNEVVESRRQRLEARLRRAQDALGVVSPAPAIAIVASFVFNIIESFKVHALMTCACSRR